MKFPFENQISINPACKFAFEEEIDSHNIDDKNFQDVFFDTGSRSMSISNFEEHFENLEDIKLVVDRIETKENKDEIQKLSNKELEDFYKDYEIKYTTKQLNEIQESKYPVKTWILESQNIQNIIQDKINDYEKMVALKEKSLSKKEKRQEKKIEAVKIKKNRKILQELNIKEENNVFTVNPLFEKKVTSGFLTKDYDELDTIEENNIFSVDPLFQKKVTFEFLAKDNDTKVELTMMDTSFNNEENIISLEATILENYKETKTINKINEKVLTKPDTQTKLPMFTETNEDSQFFNINTSINKLLNKRELDE